MPKSSLQYKEIRDERKLQILEAALPIFASHNNYATVNQICDSLDISHGLFYHYFANTEILFNELLKSETAQKTFSIIYLFDSLESPLNITRSIVEQLLLQLNDYSSTCFANILLNYEGKNCFKNKMKNLIILGQKSGDIKYGDPLEICNNFISIFQGYFYHKILDKKCEIKTPSVDSVLYTIRK